MEVEQLSQGLSYCWWCSNIRTDCCFFNGAQGEEAGLWEGVMWHDHLFSWSICKMCPPGEASHLGSCWGRVTCSDFLLCPIFLSARMMFRCRIRHARHILGGAAMTESAKTYFHKCINKDFFFFLSRLDSKKGWDSKIGLSSLKWMVWIRRCLFTYSQRSQKGRRKNKTEPKQIFFGVIK